MAGTPNQSHPIAMQLVDRLYHATDAMRAMLSRKALEELAGAANAGKVRREKQEPRKRKPSGSQTRLEIDLSYPAPPARRPQTAGGATSFHFAITSVSKVNGGKTNGALSFEVYVTDQERDCISRAVGADRYVTDDDPEIDSASRTAFVISNISSDAAEREAFWIAVNNAASTPSLPRLEVRPGCGELAELRALAGAKNTPVAVRGALNDLADQVVSSDRVGSPCKVYCVDLDAETFAAAQELDLRRFGSPRDQRLVHLARPRGGVLQWQIDAEFPDELDGEDHRTIAEEYGASIAGLDLKCTIAAHDPTGRNDPRNKHLHILIYPGSCYQSKDATWCFGGKLQPGAIAIKLGVSDSQSMMKLSSMKRAAADVRALRQRFADIVNAKLGERGVRRRYDPRTYQGMGIDQAPGWHLGSPAAALVNLGYAVDIDRENSVRGWDGALRRAGAEVSAEWKKSIAFLNRIDAADGDSSDPVFGSMRRDYVALTERLNGMLAALADFDLNEAMARSAGARLAAKTAGILQAIESRKASAAEVRAEQTYRARHELAMGRLCAVDDTLEPHRDAVEAARDEVVGARTRAREIERKILAHIEQRDGATAADRDVEKWRADTVLLPARYPHRLEPRLHFEALIEHLRNQRSPEWSTSYDRVIYAIRTSPDGDAFEASGLMSADRALVSKKPYRRRWAGALREAGKIQEKAINRVIDYIAVHGESALVLDEASPKPRTVRRNYFLFQHHPLFCQLLPDARDRFEASQGAAQQKEILTTEHSSEVSADIAAAVQASAPLHGSIDQRDGSPPPAAVAVLSPVGLEDDRVALHNSLLHGDAPDASKDHASLDLNNATPQPSVDARAAETSAVDERQSDSDRSFGSPETRASGHEDAKSVNVEPVSEARLQPVTPGSIDTLTPERQDDSANALSAASALTVGPVSDKEADDAITTLAKAERVAKGGGLSGRPAEVEEVSSIEVEPVSPQAPEVEKPSRRIEPTLLQPVRDAVERFRATPEYGRFTDSDRQAFDRCLQQPMNDLVGRRLALQERDGAIEASADSDEVIARVQALANSEAGYALLSDLAKRIPPPEMAPGKWQMIARDYSLQELEWLMDRGSRLGR